MSLESLANLATVVMGFTAVTAVAFGIWQTKEYRRQQLEAVARDRYQGFLELCVQYPEFAEPDSDLVNPAEWTFDGDRLKFIQYAWFVWAGLNALEAMFDVIGHRKSFQNTTNSILKLHAVYLGSQEIQEGANTFDPEFHAFIKPWLPKDEDDLTSDQTLVSSLAA